MKPFYLVALFLFLAPAFAGAQAISINTDASNPDPSAILDVKSTDKGMLVPRMTTVQRTMIASPTTGLLVFDTTTGGFWFFDNGIWNQIASIAVPPPIATGANNTVMPIPDNNPTGISSIINLTQAGVIDANTQIKVCIDITHTFDTDLDISLIAPDGTTIDLSSDNGLQYDNYTNTCFTTALAPGVTSGVAPFTGFWMPEQPFSNFINKPIIGNWTLKVVDDRNTDVGQLNLWSIEIPSKSIAPALLSDKDSDTKVQVEKNPDEDIIRFELSGTEGMVLRKTANGSPRLELPDGLANTFIGQSAGASNTTGGFNTANGYRALYSNTTGYQNTANGSGALYSNTTGYFNTANGESALLNNTTGYNNTANGANALFNNTTGFFNTANGMYALRSNTTGYYNTANGANALYNNTTGYYNTANGANALYNNTTGSFITANGMYALFNNTTGYYNTATGLGALYFNTTGNSNTANGMNALYNNTTGSFNTANGMDALNSNTTGSSNTANGWGALFNNTTGGYNTANSAYALYSNTTGSQNTANGAAALYSNTSGYSNVAMGVAALYQNVDRSNLVAVGDSALYNNGAGATESYHAINNTAIGSKALFSNTTGYDNTAHGFKSLYSNTTGDANSASGRSALYSNTTGDANTAIGTGALQFNTTGYDNTATGAYTLYSNTTGNSNTATGRQALLLNTTGYDNTANGLNALLNNTTGYQNAATGRNALVTNTIGTNNTAQGYSAGSLNDNSFYCTFIGNDADQTITTLTNNSMALGNESRITASNQVRIGNSSVSSIGGYAPWTDVSDGRFKQNLQADVPGLGFILKLRPVTYNLNVHSLAAHLQEDRIEDIEKEAGNTEPEPSARTLQGRDEKSRIRYTGFVAQEVEQAALAIGYDFSGVDKPQTDDGLYGLRYAEFTVPLVKAVQELDTAGKLHHQEIADLKAENAAIRTQMEAQKTQLAIQKAQLDAQSTQLKQITAALQTAGIGVGN